MQGDVSNSHAGLGVFLGVLFLVVVMAWSRVWINRRLCRAQYNMSVQERLAAEYEVLISGGMMDVVKSHLTELLETPQGGSEEMRSKVTENTQIISEGFDAKKKQAKQGKGQNDPLQEAIDRVFTNLGVKDKELREAAEAITECPSVTMELFWVAVALGLTGLCAGLAYWGWKKWSYVPDPLDACRINIMNCEDVAEFCDRPTSNADANQCKEYCKTRPLYDAECLPQHCDAEIAKIIAAGGVLYDKAEIIANCEAQCAQRAEDGYASYECKALLCSLPAEDPDDYGEFVCDAFCNNPSNRYGLYCIDRVCKDTSAGACSCNLFLNEGQESAKTECDRYCGENPSDDLCREFYCVVDEILGCSQPCGDKVPFCAPEDIAGEEIHVFQPQLRLFVSDELRLGTTEADQLYLINRDSSRNLYALAVNGRFVGMGAARQAIPVKSEAEAMLFNIIPQKSQYIYVFQTGQYEVSPGYWANLYLSYTRFGCTGSYYLNWSTKPPRAQMAVVEWWVGPVDTAPTPGF